MTDQALPSLADIAADALHNVNSAATTALGDDPATALQPVIDAVLAEAAAQRWINKQLEETGIRAMDFRNGMDMELEPARELLAHWVAAARTMLGDAPNYTETKVSMDIKVAESPELYTLVVQRHAPGALTPHEARQKAEARVEELEGALEQIRYIHKDSPMGPCPVCIDSDAHLTGGDGLVPYPCPTATLAGAQPCDPPSQKAHP